MVEQSPSQVQGDVTENDQSATTPESEKCIEITAAEIFELSDEATQIEYRRQYLIQLERRSGCRGCGD
jgi:hypothetical protein